jgi:hypothetical protein
MRYFTFPISVKAYTEAEATAKLNLLLGVGSFLVDFEIGNLTRVYIKSKLVECAGKVKLQKRKSEIYPLKTKL